MEFTFIITYIQLGHLVLILPYSYLVLFLLDGHFQLLQLAGECDFTFMQLDRAHRYRANRKIYFRYSQSLCDEWRAKRTLKFFTGILVIHTH